MNEANSYSETSDNNGYVWISIKLVKTTGYDIVKKSIIVPEKKYLSGQTLMTSESDPNMNLAKRDTGNETPK